MEVQNSDIVNLALDILEIFIQNVDNYIHVTSTFGVREALDAVINRYDFEDPPVAKRAEHIKDDIERMKPPIYNLRGRCRRVIEPKKLKTHIVVLHVTGLLAVSFYHFHIHMQVTIALTLNALDVWKCIFGEPK